MFAGSCIGVICLVISLEFLRRLSREHDRYIRRKDLAPTAQLREACIHNTKNKSQETSPDVSVRSPVSQGPVRPSPLTLILRQTIRATIHMLQFAVAYFVMLLAMYYNGYIIICIFIGAFLGAFIFSWDQMATSSPDDQQEVTYCCNTVLYPQPYVLRKIPDDDSTSYIPSKDSPAYPLALLSVNRQIHHETNPLWLKLVTLDFPSRFYMQSKLRSLPRRTLSRVQNLSVRGKSEGIKVLGERPEDGWLQVDFDGDLSVIKPIGDGMYWMWVR
ncbi:MAG: hypothetical protein Q9227_009246 [Pyrenula ochraceoflavens]